ncbi:hypothetical protein C8J56DRAFT_260210 [Mycena floridula]|nr:hypothetical protein C8J56DRAFT_260210 [Mycena floridula]
MDLKLASWDDRDILSFQPLQALFSQLRAADPVGARTSNRDKSFEAKNFETIAVELLRKPYWLRCMDAWLNCTFSVARESHLSRFVATKRMAIIFVEFFWLRYTQGDHRRYLEGRRKDFGFVYAFDHRDGKVKMEIQASPIPIPKRRGRGSDSTAVTGSTTRADVSKVQIPVKRPASRSEIIPSPDRKRTRAVTKGSISQNLNQQPLPEIKLEMGIEKVPGAPEPRNRRKRSAATVDSSPGKRIKLSPAPSALAFPSASSRKLRPRPASSPDNKAVSSQATTSLLTPPTSPRKRSRETLVKSRPTRDATSSFASRDIRQVQTVPAIPSPEVSRFETTEAAAGNISAGETPLVQETEARKPVAQSFSSAETPSNVQTVAEQQIQDSSTSFASREIREVQSVSAIPSPDVSRFETSEAAAGAPPLVQETEARKPVTQSLSSAETPSNVQTVAEHQIQDSSTSFASREIREVQSVSAIPSPDVSRFETSEAACWRSSSCSGNGGPETSNSISLEC